MKYIDQYENFRKEMIEKGAEWCFENAYKINFMRDMVDILDYYNDNPDEPLSEIVRCIEMGFTSLEILYDRFLKLDDHGVTWYGLGYIIDDEISFVKERFKDFN